MNPPDRRSVLKGALAAGALTALPGRAVAATGRPWTIPALREWLPRDGAFRPRPRVVLEAVAAERLRPGAELFADDLRALLGTAVDVVVGQPQEGDVAMRLGADDADLGTEGYRLDIGASAVVTANESAGVFYGTRSLVQLIAQGPVPAGTARDWPRHPERGLMVDIGRKHLSADWLAARVREMAFLKLNVLQLHFTDNLGWRIESDRRPLAHSEQHLTKRQAAELVALAAKHHITVVGEIDLPGHMDAALRSYPRLQLADPLGIRNPGKLDFTLPESRRFAVELIEEILPLFSSGYWHTGADEYLHPLEYHRHPQLAAFAKRRHGP